MSKPFKTIDEQIELLRYRGMTIAGLKDKTCWFCGDFSAC